MSLETRIENLEYAKIKSATAAINSAELEGIEKLRVVGVKKPDMVEKFTAAIEAIAQKHGDDAVPEEALLLYNDLYGEDETDLDKAPEKPAKSTSKKGDGKKKETKPKKPPVQPDKYGTRPNTMARKFIECLQAGPKTMEEVRKEEWNPKHYHFNETVKRLVADKLAAVDKDGKISLIE